MQDKMDQSWFDRVVAQRVRGIESGTDGNAVNAGTDSDVAS